jgi:hypothetical protein
VGALKFSKTFKAQITYNVEYRAVGGIFQNIAPPPLPLANVSRTKGGGTHSPGGERGGGVNILEDARHRIGFLQYNLSTIQSKFF